MINDLENRRSSLRQSDPDFLAAEKAQQVHGLPRNYCDTIQINLRVEQKAHSHSHSPLPISLRLCKAVADRFECHHNLTKAGQNETQTEMS